MPNREIVSKSSDNAPLPMIVAGKWDFKLNFHVVDGEHFYAVEDWIVGITGSTVRKAQIAWDNLQKRDVVLKTTSQSCIGPDGKTYHKPHTNDHGLYLIAQNLRVTKTRPALREIKEYLAKAGVFADNLRTNKDGARDNLRRELNLENPAAAAEDAVSGYRKKRCGDEWINTRLKGVGNRLIFSNTMADTCNTRPDFAGATNAGYKEMFDMVKAEIVNCLGLTKAQAASSGIISANWPFREFPCTKSQRHRKCGNPAASSPEKNRCKSSGIVRKWWPPAFTIWPNISALTWYQGKSGLPCNHTHNAICPDLHLRNRMNQRFGCGSEPQTDADYEDCPDFHL